MSPRETKRFPELQQHSWGVERHSWTWQVFTLMVLSSTCCAFLALWDGRVAAVPVYLLIKQWTLWEYREPSGIVKLPSQMATWLSPKGSEKKQSLYSKQPSACERQTQALWGDESKSLATTGQHQDAAPWLQRVFTHRVGAAHQHTADVMSWWIKSSSNNTCSSTDSCSRPRTNQSIPRAAFSVSYHPETSQLLALNCVFIFFSAHQLIKSTFLDHAANRFPWEITRDYQPETRANKRSSKSHSPSVKLKKKKKTTSVGFIIFTKNVTTQDISTVLCSIAAQCISFSNN